MDILKTLGNLAQSAWNVIWNAPSEVVSGFQKIWQFIAGLHSLISWVTSTPVLGVLKAIVTHIPQIWVAITVIRDLLGRLGNWIWVNEVYPVYRTLAKAIERLTAWTELQLTILRREMITLYFAAEAYTRMEVSTERGQRIAADRAEHAAMLAQIRALHQLVEKEASSGYNASSADRRSLIQRLLADLAARQPLVKALTGDLTKIVLSLYTIDDPLIRYAAEKLLSDIIGHLGIDKVMADLIGRLLGPLAGDPRPGSLYDVEKDVAERLSALEAQWADFMADGGPEVEQAGKGWKDGGGLVVDAAVLAFIGTAVADPQGWSTAVYDTIGIGASDAMTGIVDLIGHI